MNHQELSEFDQLNRTQDTDIPVSEEMRALYALTETPDLKTIDVEGAWEKLESEIKGVTFIPEKEKFPWLRAAIAFLIIGAVVATFLVSKIASESPMIVVKAVDQKETVNLPDGSTVWLRKGSTLSYSEANFNQDRSLSFNGEAYFDVKKGESRFNIKSENVTVQVLGTSFNLNTTSKSKSSVLVTEGTVKIGDDQRQFSVTGGQEGIIDHAESTFRILDTPDINQLSWKTGVFKFENMNMGKATDYIEAYYEIQITLSESLKNCKITGSFQQLDVDEMLEELAVILSLTTTRTENSYFLQGEGC